VEELRFQIDFIFLSPSRGGEKGEIPLKKKLEREIKKKVKRKI